MISLEEGVELVWHAFDDMKGGEIYVKKIPSMNITDIAKAVSESAKHKIIGVRPGEKIHEQMIGLEDAPHTYEYSDHYKILPAIYNWSSDPQRNKGGVKVDEDFTYSSGSNEEWMSVDELQDWIEANKSKIGKI
jgi:FlaA1/EpsC-like NDP-sugar epimerase